MKKLIILFLLIANTIFAQDFDYKNYSAFLKKYVSEKGNVNYDKIKANKKELNEIIDEFEKIQPTNKWSEDDKMAYYINTYNVFTLKAVVDEYPIKSIKDIRNVWDKKNIVINEKKYSLSNIENDLLRKMGDARIHFAINCASFSCPMLENTAYLPEKLNKQLEIATKNFINDKTKNILSEKEVRVSEIFNWFSADFKSSGGVIAFISKYTTVDIDKKAKIKYVDYNWSLNK